MRTPGTIRRVLQTVSLIAIIAALAGAGAVSKLYWGYFFVRPGVPPRILDAEQYRTLTTFRSIPEGPETATGLVAKKDAAEPARLLNLVRTESYDFSNLKVLEEVDRRGQISALPRMDDAQVSALLELIKESDVLEEPKRGYDDEQWLNGLALEALQADGTRLLYIAAQGGQVSNDHYPNYQLLFEVVPNHPPRLVESTTFFNDVAGVEGMEWPFFFVAFVLPALILSNAAVLLVTRLRDRSRDFA